jgi:hypothetical protein
MLRVTQKFWPKSQWVDEGGRLLVATSEVYWAPGVGASLIFETPDGERVAVESRARLAELQATE